MADNKLKNEQDTPLGGDTEKPRDPENRPATTDDEKRERAYDKTMADSFPTSDPPSSIPDPAEVDEEASDEAA